MATRLNSLPKGKSQTLRQKGSYDSINVIPVPSVLTANVVPTDLRQLPFHTAASQFNVLHRGSIAYYDERFSFH